MKILFWFLVLGLIAVSTQVSLNDDQQEIVNKVKDVLSKSTQCPRVVAEIKNIQQQVVAGTLYKMDLVLKGHPNNGAECIEANQKKTCHMRVIDVPWEKRTDILWEDGTCDKPVPIDNKLTNCQQEVVDFVELSLTGIPGGPIIDCPREVVSVEKFSSQVVAGTLYKMDIVLKGHSANDASCGRFNEETKCRMQVLDVPWENGKSIIWEESTCEHPGKYNEDPPIVGGHEEIQGDLNQKQKEVVEFAESSLNPFNPTNNCVRKIVNVDKFKQQVVAGTLYNLDIVIEGHKANDASCGTLNQRTSCKMQVLDVPWEGGKSVVWEESTCQRLTEEENIPIAGGITEIQGDLNQDQQEIVDFAELSLNPLGPIAVNCARKIVNVDKFSQQVVAGTLYNLDIVTEGHKTNDVSCGRFNARTSCKMQVLDVPWENGLSVIWEESTCDQLADVTTNPPPPGSPVKIDGPLTGEQQEIVEYVKLSLSSSTQSSCPRKVHRIVNFSEQLVAGTVYKIDVDIEGHSSNSASCGELNARKVCQIKVYDVPWENKREILWEESTCEKSNGGSEINFPIAGGASEVIVKQPIVDFAYEQFSSTPGAVVSACGTKKVVRTENFTEQVVAGFIYTFDIVLDYEEPCPDYIAQTCSMKVYVDLSGQKELQQSKCN